MIIDDQTNFVYFSGKLKTEPVYRSFYNELTSVLDSHEVHYDFLTDTNDIWCRDYMPVQISEDRFIEYRFDPDYLYKKGYRKWKTYSDLVCDRIGLKTIKSDLILDGGNVIKGINKVILSDKIIPENSAKYLKANLLKEIRTLFEMDTVILIPWYTKEETGHADGIVRFIDDDHVLIDGYWHNGKSEIGEKFLKVLRKNRLIPISFEFNVSKQSKYNWGYVNYLQMENLILFPQFGIEEDIQALNQIKKVFPEYDKKGQIEKIDCSGIIGEGGAMNCVSWNIKRKKFKI